MMSWGFPLIHVAVPFSSVSQVLFIILGFKPPYLHRGVLGITMKFGGELTLQSQKWQFSTPPPAVKLMLVALLSMSRESP